MYASKKQVQEKKIQYLDCTSSKTAKLEDTKIYRETNGRSLKIKIKAAAESEN